MVLGFFPTGDFQSDNFTSDNFPKVLFPKGYVRPSEIPQAAMGADHAAARMC